MYFIWKSSIEGALRISEKGMCVFVQEILNRGTFSALNPMVCSSFVLDGESGLIVLNQKNEKAEAAISKLMESMGLPVKFIYTYEGAPDVLAAEKISESFRSPWFWCFLLVITALAVLIGVRGVFWLSFWGAVGWFAAKVVPLISSLFQSRRSTFDTDKI